MSLVAGFDCSPSFPPPEWLGERKTQARVKIVPHERMRDAKGREKIKQERKKEEKLIESTDNSRPASAVNDQNL